jgi:muramoyltetrapeptide carboxypeptidase
LPALRKAHALRPGDCIGIATPASPIEEEHLEAGETLIRELGFEPRRGIGATDRCGYLAGDDDQRARQLMGLIGDPDVRAILCARGGYGCHRIVSRLDAAAFRKAAKPLVGYSDITTLLLWQRRAAGLMGIHGAMLERGGQGVPGAHRALVDALTGVGSPMRLSGRPLIGAAEMTGSDAAGWREGRLTGGSLSLIVASLGTPWEIDTRGSILLLEEVHELPYRVDRMLQQLLAAGKLEAVIGIGIGAMVDCADSNPEGPSVEDVLVEILGPLGVPTVIGLPFGHGEQNLPWPHGGRAAIDAERGEIELLEFAVARS